jgi:hypothetical protein
VLRNPVDREFGRRDQVHDVDADRVAGLDVHVAHAIGQDVTVLVDQLPVPEAVANGRGPGDGRGDPVPRGFLGLAGLGAEDDLDGTTANDARLARAVVDVTSEASFANLDARLDERVLGATLGATYVGADYGFAIMAAWGLGPGHRSLNG